MDDQEEVKFNHQEQNSTCKIIIDQTKIKEIKSLGKIIL